MKLKQSGLFLLLIIYITSLVIFYVARDNTQKKLNQEIIKSLELNQQAALALSSGEIQEAHEKLLESLSLNKLNPETYVYFAFAEYMSGNFQNAYEYFISSLNMEVISAEIIYNMSDILVRSGHYSEAEIILQYGLLDFPDDKHLLFLLDKVNWN